MKVEVREIVAAPLEEVFAAFSDFHRASERISGIKKIDVLTPGPIGVGTRFRETRVMFGRECAEEMEITAFDSHNRYTVECRSGGAHYISTFSFERAEAGTRVHMSFAATPTSFFARLFAPLGWLMAGSLKKCMENDVRDLKAFCEGDRAAEPAASPV